MVPLRVLLADDSPAFLESAARFLAMEPQIGVVGRALSGLEVVEQTRRLQPDLVLMDVAMPQMNGLEATHRIKAQSRPPRVVILTLHDTPEYRAAAEAAHADGFVIKSQFASELLPLIERLFPDPSANPEGVNRGMQKVLIVDDSPTMRRMVKASLAGLDGVDFDEAATGLEAVERLTLARVDLIVLDLNIPEMHGLDVLRFMQQHNAFRNIPVIALTTRGDEGSRSATLRAGAALYLTKPFEPQALAGHARQLLRGQAGG